MLPPFPGPTFNDRVTLPTGCWPEHRGVVHWLGIHRAEAPAGKALTGL